MAFFLSSIPFVLLLATMALCFARRHKDDPWSYWTSRTLVVGVVLIFVISFAIGSAASYADSDAVGLLFSVVAFVVVLAGLFFFFTGMSQRNHREGSAK